MLPSIFPFSFDGEANEGDSVQLTCHVAKGDLPLRIRWTHNDLPLFSHLGVMASKIGERVSLLTVETVKAVHSGNYSCVASNNAGNISYTSELFVNGLLNHISIKLRYLCIILITLNTLPSSTKSHQFRLR